MQNVLVTKATRVRRASIRGWGDASEQRPLLQRQTVHQALQLLLSQLDLVLQFALLDDERRLHLHKVAVVVYALRGQVGLHDPGHKTLPTVQVLLQLLGVFVLPHQQLSLLRQGALVEERESTKDVRSTTVHTCWRRRVAPGYSLGLFTSVIYQVEQQEVIHTVSFENIDHS